MKRLIDKTGLKFGRLTVICRGPNKGKSARWKCVCECGKETLTHTSQLRDGSKVSCGCRRAEVSSRMMTEMSLKHGESRTSLYVVWREMRYRCNTKTARAYPGYGGRGIKVCPEWDKSFEAFRDWSKANGYQENLSIDRIENNGNYEPNNCRWADMETQSNNRRSSLYLTYQGKTQSATQWARELGLNKATVFYRIRIGLSVEEIFNPLISPINKPQYRAA